MAFSLPALPFAKDALEPHLSARTFEFHHGKHHNAYVTKLNSLLDSSDLAAAPLKEVIRRSAGDPAKAGLFNNSAQVYNHEFYWNCMKPGGGGEPQGDLAKQIAAAFGSYSEFREKFTAAAVNLFGSGWAWLVLDGNALKIETGANAGTPVAQHRRPLLTVDVWEHAYYLDYQNARPKYVDVFLDHLVNWDFVAQNLEAEWEPTA